MFHFGLSWQELVLVLLAVAATMYFRGARRRWMGVLVATMGLSTVITPADPISTLAVAAPLSIAFALGVRTAPFFGLNSSSAK